MPVVNYFWNPVKDNVAEEYDENGDTIAKYTSEAGLYGNLLSQHRGGATNYYHYDGQGNTLALTDENGDVTDTYAYNAFGETTEQTGATENPYRYVGELGYQYNEETSDYYVRERTYEPTIARWLSADPIGFVDGINLYVYVKNSASGLSDPSGLLHVETKEVPPVGLKCNSDLPKVTYWFVFDSKYRKRGEDKTGAPCAGYVVQKVSVRCCIEECSCGPCDTPNNESGFDKFDYWEMWKVAKRDEKVIDKAFIPAFGKYCTDYTQTTEIRFYCNTNTKDVGKGIGTKPFKDWTPGKLFGADKGRLLCSTGSGGLPATVNEPGFWSDSSKNSIETSAKRSYHVVGDCCNGNDDVEVTVDPSKV